MLVGETASAEADGVARAVRVLHLSDIHCGRSFVAAHVAAAERVAAASRFDAIVVSGDLSQRAREAEFRSARVILDRLQATAPTIVVPGNHDSQWWNAPFGIGQRDRVHELWRALVQKETEPTLRVPGVSMIGVNSAAGVMPWTLTWNPRDLRVKGGITHTQIDNARARLAASPTGDLRIVVMHHNVVRGRLSSRWGLARPQHALDAFAEIGVDVMCNGHDHEERVEAVSRSTGSFVASTANTLSSRMRGHRPSALNVIEADAKTIAISSWVFDVVSSEFKQGPVTTAPRQNR